MANKNGFFSKLFNKAEDKPEKAAGKEFSAGSEIIVQSPMKGSLIPLSDVKDEVFSQGMMGKGIAILPDEGKLYSPVTGKVAAVFPTKHAIGIVGSSGVEILIHVGMDTVELNGKYYKLHVKKDDAVRIGELLLEFDMDKIKASGYEVVTPVVITNPMEFSDIVVSNASNVNISDRLMTAIR